MHFLRRPRVYENTTTRRASRLNSHTKPQTNSRPPLSATKMDPRNKRTNKAQPAWKAAADAVAMGIFSAFNQSTATPEIPAPPEQIASSFKRISSLKDFNSILFFLDSKISKKNNVWDQNGIDLFIKNLIKLEIFTEVKTEGEQNNDKHDFSKILNILQKFDDLELDADRVPEKVYSDLLHNLFEKQKSVKVIPGLDSQQKYLGENSPQKNQNETQNSPENVSQKTHISGEISPTNNFDLLFGPLGSPIVVDARPPLEIEKKILKLLIQFSNNYNQKKINEKHTKRIHKIILQLISQFPSVSTTDMSSDERQYITSTKSTLFSCLQILGIVSYHSWKSAITKIAQKSDYEAIVRLIENMEIFDKERREKGNSNGKTEEHSSTSEGNSTTSERNLHYNSLNFMPPVGIYQYVTSTLINANKMDFAQKITEMKQNDLKSLFNDISESKITLSQNLSKKLSASLYSDDIFSSSFVKLYLYHLIVNQNNWQLALKKILRGDLSETFSKQISSQNQEKSEEYRGRIFCLCVYFSLLGKCGNVEAIKKSIEIVLNKKLNEKISTNSEKGEGGAKSNDILELGDFPELDMDSSSYGAIIFALGKIGEVNFALETFQEMVQKGIQPSPKLIAILIRIFTKAQRISEALDLYENSRNLYNTPPDLHVSTAALIAAGRTNQRREVHKILSQIFEEFSFSEIDPYAFSTIIFVLTSLKMYRQASDIISRISVSFSGRLLKSPRLVFTIIKFFGKIGEIQKAAEFFSRYETDVVKVVQEEETEEGEAEGEAEREGEGEGEVEGGGYVGAGEGYDFIPVGVDADVYAGFADVLAKNGKKFEALRILRKMESRGLRPSAMGYNVVQKIMLGEYDQEQDALQSRKQNM